MKSDELRQKFLQFFQKNGHKIIPSASLIPDGTGANQKTLFVTAGMQPLIPFLLGEKHPKGKRLVDIQKCFRTIDIDEVGDDTHNTFFEMLGNWSLGDYWKQESIQWSFEFLTKELNIPLERLAVSCFKGDDNVPKDEESAKIWESFGVKKERISFLPKEDNWWGPVGETGPCGPDTEIFYWKLNDIPVPKKFDPTDKNWVEIWNNVFMEYVKDSNGNYVVAEQKNVDTGMGFERTLAVINGYTNIYETDLFESLFLQEAFKPLDVRHKRIIADHLRAAVFLIDDGVVPSNKDQGYVLRRLLRKTFAIEYLFKLSAQVFEDVIIEMINQYAQYYPTLLKNRDQIINSYFHEWTISKKEFERGIKEYNKKSSNALSGAEAFQISSTYALPLEVIVEFEREKDRDVEKLKKEWSKEFKKHQEKSRTSSAGMFKGGLVDHSPETIKLHTAHHLLLTALQEVFGKTVKQKGSNINSERLRIDFSFDRKLTDEEKKKIENIVNEKINDGLSIIKKEMPRQEAEKIGAEMEFGVKYGDMVSVYFIEDKKGNIFSKEFCGGPHAVSTDELGKFKIIKEEASSSGIRRIKAVLE